MTQKNIFSYSMLISKTYRIIAKGDVNKFNGFIWQSVPPTFFKQPIFWIQFIFCFWLLFCFSFVTFSLWVQAEASLQSMKLHIPEGIRGTSWVERGSWVLKRRCIAARSRLTENKEKKAFRHFFREGNKEKGNRTDEVQSPKRRQTFL